MAAAALGAWRPTRSYAGPTPSSPPFRVVQDGGNSWLVDPAGRRFFSSGVCCVTPGEAWDTYDPSRPAYAAWRQYPDGTAWADMAVARLKQWGFTTVGGWSDYATLKRSRRMDLPYTMVLHLGASAGAPWWDMWDPKVIGAMDSAARSQIVPVRSDPRLLGYYTDNEMGWWNAALFQFTLSHSPRSEQRRHLVATLWTRYGGSWQRLLRDFVPSGVASFEGLRRGGKLFLRPGGDGTQAMQQFAALAADRYYDITKEVVRKYDRRGLLLGDRYQSFYYPEVAAAAGRYEDAVSTNLNPTWLDGTYPRFFLDTLHAIAGRPIAVGEYYMTAAENGSGDPNSSSGFPVVQTQAERARGFTTTLTALARTPYVMGADWFQYSDEPPGGRGDGENYDFGLVDIADRPYGELTSAASALDRNALHAAAPPVPLDARGGVPPAPAHPLAEWQPMHAMLAWDRERGFAPPSTAAPTADLYLCWDADALYVGLFAMDVVEPEAYADKKLPETDRAEWTVNPGGATPIRIRLGAGRPPAVRGAQVEVVDRSGTGHDVWNVGAVRLPARLFGRDRLAAGEAVHLDCRFVGHARSHSVEWRGTYHLAGRR